jgi:hypothetical protein
MADDEKTKKEKVLHTRISESLDGEIRDHASQLGVSVSNLVRNVLQNTFGLVGDIVADSSNIAASAKGSQQPASGDAPVMGWVSPATGGPTTSQPAAAPLVLGWQEALLALNGVCDCCNSILPKGTRAAIALYEGAGPRTFRCLTCLKAALEHEPETKEPSDEPES